MSAYICNEDHIKALAIFAADRYAPYPGGGHLNVDPRYVKGLPQYDSKGNRQNETLTHAELASLYADVLYQENVRSVRSRYPNDSWETLPGPCSKPLRMVVSNRELGKHRLSPVAILKMCDGLEYQSCETRDYRQTVAFALLERIRGAAIRQLPGYEDAPWEYSAAA